MHVDGRLRLCSTYIPTVDAAYVRWSTRSRSGYGETAHWALFAAGDAFAGSAATAPSEGGADGALLALGRACDSTAS